MKIARRPYLSARKPQAAVPMNSPENSAAMKLATPLVPKRPGVVWRQNTASDQPGRDVPCEEEVIDSKKNPKLNIRTSFQIDRVGGRRSSRAEISPIAIGAASSEEVRAGEVVIFAVAELITFLLPEHLVVFLSALILIVTQTSIQP